MDELMLNHFKCKETCQHSKMATKATQAWEYTIAPPSSDTAVVKTQNHHHNTITDITTATTAPCTNQNDTARWWLL